MIMRLCGCRDIEGSFHGADVEEAGDDARGNIARFDVRDVLDFLDLVLELLILRIGGIAGEDLLGCLAAELFALGDKSLRCFGGSLDGLGGSTRLADSDASTEGCKNGRSLKGGEIGSGERTLVEGTLALNKA